MHCLDLRSKTLLKKSWRLGGGNDGEREKKAVHNLQSSQSDRYLQYPYYTTLVKKKNP